MSMIALHKRLLGGSPRVYWREQDYGTLGKLYGVSEETVARLASGEPDAAPPPPLPKGKSAVRKSYGFTLSDGSMDRMGDIVEVAGISLQNYWRNPVVLWGHSHRSLPIGRSTSIGMQNGRLRATVELATDSSELAEQIARLLAGGVLKSASIGFRPTEFSFNHKRGGFDFKQIDLLEWSVVTVPALPTATLEPGQLKSMTAGEWQQQQRRADRRRREVELLKIQSEVL